MSLATFTHPVVFRQRRERIARGPRRPAPLGRRARARMSRGRRGLPDSGGGPPVPDPARRPGSMTLARARRLSHGERAAARLHGVKRSETGETPRALSAGQSRWRQTRQSVWPYQAELRGALLAEVKPADCADDLRQVIRLAKRGICRPRNCCSSGCSGPRPRRSTRSPR